MNEERLERIEQHLVQLIQMVGENNQAIKGLERRMDQLEQRMDHLEQRMNQLDKRVDKESELNRLRHQELVKEVRYVHFDIEYLRNQTSKHDMEIHKLQQTQS